MSQPMMSADVIAMLRRPNAAVIATLRSDGQPVTAATWYLWEDDGRILVNMAESRVRLGHMRRDPRVSLTVIDESNWYTHVTVIGRATQIGEDEGLSGIDRLSRQYQGQDYPDRDSKRYNAWIEVERWHLWGSLKAE